MIAEYVNTVGAPGPSKLSFVLIGNPQRANTGWAPTSKQSRGPLYPNIPANKPYQITGVARQYDGWADWPNNTASPGYPKAALDAEICMATIHDDFFSVDLNSAGNARWTQGNITWRIPVNVATGRLAH